MTKTFWLSFCDGDKPPGHQFLGACIVTVTLADPRWALAVVRKRFPRAKEGAQWLAAAGGEAWRLGCNPGGEIAFTEIEGEHPLLRYFATGRLLSRQDISEIDARIAHDMAGALN